MKKKKKIIRIGGEINTIKRQNWQLRKYETYEQRFFKFISRPSQVKPKTQILMKIN